MLTDQALHGYYLALRQHNGPRLEVAPLQAHIRGALQADDDRERLVRGPAGQPSERAEFHAQR